jgi:hypothetical protein
MGVDPGPCCVCARSVRDDHAVNANTALVLITCVASLTGGVVIVAAIRGAVEIVRIVRGPGRPEKVIR